MKINRLEIQGFRAFGKVAQELELKAPIACIWGINSQGKTSLAEAIEFLLTGQIIRRELLSSTQDEFTDALRNVHMPKALPVYVEAAVACARGVCIVRRTLKTDYGKKQDCQTILEIDGRVAQEGDLAGLGIVLSQPPLRAPVLAQHTLAYLFSAKPQERAGYFKALLEVTDLDALRNSLTGLEGTLPAAQNPLPEKLTSAAEITVAAAVLKPLSAKVPKDAALRAALSVALAAVLQSEKVALPGTLPEQAAALEELLSTKRTETFPVRGFDKQAFAGWLPSFGDQLDALATYIAERAKVDKETGQLVSLFIEALALPPVESITDPVDCPLCAAAASLTPARVTLIRQRVADNAAFSAALNAADKVLLQLHDTVDAAEKQLVSSLPHFMTFPSSGRRKRGFRVERIRSLLGDGGSAAIAAWLSQLKGLVRAHAAACRILRPLRSDLAAFQKDLDQLTDIDTLRGQCATAIAAVARYHQALLNYLPGEKAISDALNSVIDSQTQTKGWQDLADIAKDAAGLRAGLVELAALLQMRKEIAAAIKQIDAGNEKVLEEKFDVLSGGVTGWWNLLRPDDHSFFSAVRPRPGARRTIDFKAGLSAHDDRSNPALRDVIAVFSQSQLHCLGLALFLARAEHEKAELVVLDDPILSSDEGYRAHFNSAVLEKLLDGGKQVILLTQDQKTCKDVTELYMHRPIDTFEINLSNPAEGTTVINRADDLGAMLASAETLSRGGHPSLSRQAGEILRNAAERLCKEILVKDRRTKGDKVAAISDYDGKVLGELESKVQPLLVKDPGHPAKLRVLGSNLNPAKHDDNTPPRDVLRVALGDLKLLRRTYL